MEIAQILFELFNSYELDDLSFLNEVDNHYKHLEPTEISLHARTFRSQDDLEDTTIRYIRLHAAIDSLPEVQRRHLWLYFLRNIHAEKSQLWKAAPKEP